MSRVLIELLVMSENLIFEERHSRLDTVGWTQSDGHSRIGLPLYQKKKAIEHDRRHALEKKKADHTFEISVFVR